MEDRPANRNAKLVLLVRRFRQIGAKAVLRGIKSVIAQELPRAPVNSICSRLGGGIDDSAATASKLRRVIGGLNLEFGDGINAAQDGDISVVIGVVVDAIEQEIVLVAAHAVDGKTPACIAVGGRAATVNRSLDDFGYPGGELGKIGVTSPVQRQQFDCLACHDIAEGGALGLEQRSGSTDLYGLRYGADLQSEVESNGLLHIEHDVVSYFFAKPGGFDGDGVPADMERSNQVVAVNVALHGGVDPRVHVGGCYGDIGQ